MSIIALFATANTAVVHLIVASRMIYGMGRAGFVPRFLSKISRRGTPWVGSLMVMVLSASFVLLGNMEFVAEITNFGTCIILAFVNLSAIALRYRKPE